MIVVTQMFMQGPNVAAHRLSAALSSRFPKLNQVLSYLLEYHKAVYYSLLTAISSCILLIVALTRTSHVHINLKMRLHLLLLCYKLQRSSLVACQRYKHMLHLGPKRYPGQSKLPYHLLLKSRHRDQKKPEKISLDPKDGRVQSRPDPVPNQTENSYGFCDNKIQDDPLMLAFDKVFESRLDQFCRTTDFLQLHKLSSMFIGSSKVQSTYESIQQAWKALAPLSSTRIHFNAENDSFLHPGCIFFSRTSRRDTPIVADTGASSSVTPFREDFVQFTESRSTVTGIGSKTEVLGYGTVRWKIYDQNQRETVIETKALYMPTANIHLYSPQAHFQANKSGSLFMNSNEIKIQFPHSKTSYSFPFHGSCSPLLSQRLYQWSRASGV